MRTFMNLENLTEDELYRYERYKVFGFPTTAPTTEMIISDKASMPQSEAAILESNSDLIDSKESNKIKDSTDSKILTERIYISDKNNLDSIVGTFEAIDTTKEKNK